MSSPAPLENLVASIRPTLTSVSTTPAERAQLVYDLVREVYDHVKFDVHGADVDTDERSRLGDVLDAALPPVAPIVSKQDT
ncbi:hypothetical protein [uncultured Aeromicrobium sp.]|uniref:hypothetical protein n=1 Tax=uncultured Aeromicrobium sp. TaxID=337820 RepID=UPI0025D188B6|nr:hypothetical protein [uncultured Aeromicrobium sp.]